MRPKSSLLLIAASLTCAMLAAAPLRAEPVEKMDRLMVTGEQPGPGMWKVSRDGRVLWIVGTHTPVPKNLTWKAGAVDAVVASANEVLTAPSVSVTASQIGYFSSLLLVPSAMLVPYNPDDRPLKDFLPPPLFARWEVLRDRYLAGYNADNNQVDRWRPWFAAQRLYRAALDRSGLQSADPVWPRVAEVAGKAKVAITKVTYTPQISNARAAVKEFNANPLADLECFTKTLDRVESDLGAMRARANAWARGNVDAIRKLPETDHTAACNGVFLNSPLSKALGGIDVRATLEGAWIGAAERALQRSRVSVAVLPVTRLVEPGGYLEALRSKGYQVEEPE